VSVREPRAGDRGVAVPAPGRRARAALATAARGFCMGAADVVPGVSGGTMAFILGIYPRLLAAIRAFDLGLLRLLARREFRGAVRHVDLGFLAALVAGIFAALMFFTRVVPLPRLIETDPEPVYGLFFGLIAASIAVLLHDLPGSLGGARDWLALAAGAALGWLLVNLVPTDTPETAWFVFVSGALAICAMILPGVSGSFILLVLNKYAYVFAAIGRLDVAVLAPFALGAVCGLMAFSRVLMWLLEHHRRPAIVAITGLLAGSLWAIWPFQQRTYAVVGGESRLIRSTPAWPEALDAGTWLALAGAAAGLALVLGLHAWSTRRARSHGGGE